MYRLAVGLAVGLLVSLATAPADAAAAFQYSIIDPAGPAKAWGKASADMDGDGRVDFLIGGHSESTPGLYWYRNPDWKRRTISARALIGTDIEVVDLNRDGRQDVIATTDTGGVPGITAFIKTPSTWVQRRLVVGARLHDIEVADLNQDGLLDLVGRGQSLLGNRIRIWRQGPPNRWTASSIALPIENGDGLKVADVDRDGRQDLVIPRYWLRNVATDGSLAFTRLTYNRSAPANAVIEMARINDDRMADIIASPAHRAGSYGRISWFRAPERPADGAIWDEIVIENRVERDSHFIGIADFDRNGTNDVATAMTELTRRPRVKLYYNLSGTGNFTAPQILANTSSHEMQVIRVDNDRFPSLVGADYDRKDRTVIKLWRQSPYLQPPYQP
jgi:hypothetical protein